MDLHVVWFVLLGSMLMAYAVLDGFDLGVGLVLNLFARGDSERRLVLGSIGPLWDGNEVWLVCFGGAFFGSFPEAYATAFSGFYLPFMALLAALLLRAVAMEVRDQETSPVWRYFWDGALGVACLLTCTVFGFMIANALQGLAIGPNHEFKGMLGDLFGLFGSLIALKTVVLFSLHGVLYLRMRLPSGALLDRINRWALAFYFSYLALYAVVAWYTVTYVPWSYTSDLHMSLGRAAMVLKIVLMAGLFPAILRARPLTAFWMSAANIACLCVLYGVALFPNLLVSSLNPEWNLNIWTSASTDNTLRAMGWVALLGTPLALTYTCIVYWVFGGKARPMDE